MAERSNEGDVTLYPAWREAVRQFEFVGFGHGSLIPHATWWEFLGMTPPAHDAPHYVARRAEAAYFRHMGCVVEFLLTERQIALENVHGEGWRVVPPDEQTAWAEREAGNGLAREMRKGLTRLTNVDLGALTDASRKENSDALARMSRLSGMLGIEVGGAAKLTNGRGG